MIAHSGVRNSDYFIVLLHPALQNEELILILLLKIIFHFFLDIFHKKYIFADRIR